ncbi:MAG: hypothetical protein J5768_02095 [Spirochaetales bacterium]|nr:hypothetical protein [Spirochaetales bacterium]
MKLFGNQGHRVSQIGRKDMTNSLVALVILVAFIGCNANFVPSFKDSITDSDMRSRVSRVIDAQLENIKDQLDDDLKAGIDSIQARGADGQKGEQIVELTLEEEHGRDYLDFCYAVDSTQTSMDVDAVMDTAKCILPADKFEELLETAAEVERVINLMGDEIARAIPFNQQAAFYKDLKALVTRAVVLLVAGVVYACIPNVVFWGKISAACAIAVGAGLVAVTIMSLYEYYRFGTGEGQSFEDWFKELIEIPKADFALTTAITAMAEALSLGPVVTGIIICIYGLYHVVDMVRTMMKTYNFDA